VGGGGKAAVANSKDPSAAAAAGSEFDANGLSDPKGAVPNKKARAEREACAVCDAWLKKGTQFCNQVRARADSQSVAGK
jgi:hypothetical protein